MAKLTTRQEAFVEEYLIDRNATQAAIRAGYSPKSASTIAGETMRNPQVHACIARAMAERSRRTGIHQDRVLQELAKIAFVKLTDLIDADGALLPDADPDDLACIESIKVKQIAGKCGERGVEREVRLSSKLKALELLGRHLGLFNDKLSLEGVLPVVITGGDQLED